MAKKKTPPRKDSTTNGKPARRKKGAKPTRKKAVRNLPRRKYKTNYLTKVIARVDFSPEVTVSADKQPNSVSASLRKRFPIAEFKVSAHPQMTVSTGSQDSSTTFSIQHEHHWLFYSKNRERYYELTEKSVLVSYDSYDSYERLLDDFIPVLEHFLRPVKGLRIHRLGLRYVDSIESAETRPTVWNKYLREEILTMFKLADDQKTISRAFNILEFNYGDDMQLRFQYGMPNPDYPAPIKKKLFVLDWDAYASGVALDLHDVRGYLDRFHEKINLSFEEVITDELRTKMGVTNA